MGHGSDADRESELERGRTRAPDNKTGPLMLFPLDGGPSRGITLPCLEGVLTIGRTPEAGLQLNNPSVSRRHALIFGRAFGPTLRDGGSSYGTFVNGSRLQGAHVLIAGDVIRLGAVSLVVQPSGWPARAPGATL